MGNEGDAVSQSPSDIQDQQCPGPPVGSDVLASLPEEARRAVERLIAERAHQIYEGLKKEEELKSQKNSEEDDAGASKAKRGDDMMQSHVNRMQQTSADADEVSPPPAEKPPQPASPPMSRQLSASASFS